MGPPCSGHHSLFEFTVVAAMPHPEDCFRALLCPLPLCSSAPALIVFPGCWEELGLSIQQQLLSTLTAQESDLTFAHIGETCPRKTEQEQHQPMNVNTYLECIASYPLTLAYL